MKEEKVYNLKIFYTQYTIHTYYLLNYQKKKKKCFDRSFTRISKLKKNKNNKMFIKEFQTNKFFYYTF